MGINAFPEPIRAYPAAVRPDGSFSTEAPGVLARRLDAEYPDWCVWHGPRTGRFFAVTRYGPPLLVEAGTAGELVEWMRWMGAARRA